MVSSEKKTENLCGATRVESGKQTSLGRQVPTKKSSEETTSKWFPTSQWMSHWKEPGVEVSPGGVYDSVVGRDKGSVETDERRQ